MAAIIAIEFKMTSIFWYSITYTIYLLVFDKLPNLEFATWVIEVNMTSKGRLIEMVTN